MKEYTHKSKKEELKVKRFKKHKLLSKYAKLCKAEGIESNRVKVDGIDSSNRTHDSVIDHKANDKKGGKPKGKRNYLLEEAEKNREIKLKEREVKQQQYESIQKEIEQKVKQREKANKERMKRTSRGQPIMKNQISSILNKLHKEKGL